MPSTLRWILSSCLLGLGSTSGAGEPRHDTPRPNSVLETATAIRAEATRKMSDPEGRPLPLASHWTTGRHPRSQGWRPVHQLALIEQGHHILPWFAHPPRESEWSDATRESFVRDYRATIEQARDWGLPLVFVASQWESGLSTEPYLSLPPERNPRVIFLSNNEHAKLTWPNVEKSQRYLQEHGPGKDDDFKRRVVGEGWIERYRALQQGMRDGLVSPAWRERSCFVGYGAFGPEFIGRWPGWPTYSLHVPGRICPHPLMWDGGSVLHVVGRCPKTTPDPVRFACH